MMDEAAAREIERLKTEVSALDDLTDRQSVHLCELAHELGIVKDKLAESERQRKALAEHLEALGIEGINAATGAGR